MANSDVQKTAQANPLYVLSGAPAMQQQSQSNLESRIARIENIVPYQLGGGGIAPTRFSPLDSSGVTDGVLNLGSTGSINFVGSLSPSVIDGLFAVASPSDSTATIYWDGTNTSRVFLIRRADSQGQGLAGTSTTIPGSSITISGLTHNVMYSAYAYWSPFNQCGLGWAPGSIGTPAIAHPSTETATQINQAIAQQHLAGREIIGSIQWTQPNAGGNTPAGPPTDPPFPDPGSCVMIGTDLKPLGSWPIDTENYRWEDWVRIETNPGGCFTRGLNCTPNHPLYDSENGKVDADFFVGKSRWIMTKDGEEKVMATTRFLRGCTKVKAMMKHGHLFWANGFLSHNVKPNLG